MLFRSLHSRWQEGLTDGRNFRYKIWIDMEIGMEQEIDTFIDTKDYETKIVKARKIISYIRKHPDWHLSLDKRRKEIVRGAKRFWTKAASGHI